MDVALVLVPLFLAVGVWLLVYSRRRRRMMTTFAARHGLAHRPADDGSLEEVLDRVFALPRPFARAFSRIRDVVEGDGVRLFRCTELLDLSRHGAAQNTHAGRIAALVDVGGASEAFLRVRRDGTLVPVLPGTHADPAGNPELEGLRRELSRNPPPHTLSVSLSGGNLLLYLEPGLTGSEKPGDVEYLFRLATGLRGG